MLKTLWPVVAIAIVVAVIVGVAVGGLASQLRLGKAAPINAPIEELSLPCWTEGVTPLPSVAISTGGPVVVFYPARVKGRMAVFSVSFDIAQLMNREPTRFRSDPTGCD